MPARPRRAGCSVAFSRARLHRRVARGYHLPPARFWLAGLMSRRLLATVRQWMSPYTEIKNRRAQEDSVATIEIEVKLNENNELTLPDEVIKRLRLEPGNRLVLELDDDKLDQ